MDGKLVIAEIGIRQDRHGRFCLNDLHKAAGNLPKHKPSEYLRLQQAKELIEEIERHKAGITALEQNQGVGAVNAKAGIPALEQNQAVRTVHGGNQQGVYAVKELVYAYAMWISPKFNLAVIRAYDDMVMGVRNGLKVLADKPAPFELAAAVKKEAEILLGRMYDKGELRALWEKTRHRETLLIIMEGLNQSAEFFSSRYDCEYNLRVAVEDELDDMKNRYTALLERHNHLLEKLLISANGN